MDKPIPFHVLEKTTEGFSDKQLIGSGGYGKVYKGVYNGEPIAVKLFYDAPGLDNKTFENEFFNILRIQHPNVVRLVGYCYETQHKHVVYNGDLRFSQHIYRILCFELMQGGSLDKYINAESRDHDWPTCYDIIKGTCEGLNYLHRGCGSQILHLDLKPANILLEKNMRAKVADFGLSRFFSTSHTHITNTTTGTADYMPPEFWSKRQISPKNDVYSLGVIIIEILAGHRGYMEFREMDDVTPFIELVTTNWRQWINATSSPCPSAELDQVETCIKIAIECVDQERKNRPTVAEILDNLRETEKKFRLVGQICFGPSEFIEEVSGAYGSYRGIIRVKSLTFVTNVRTYGPFGNPYHRTLAVTHFRFMADEGSSIVGFHGRSGSYIDAIGVYMYPSNRTEVRALSVPLIIDGQRFPTPTKSGPWGGSGGSPRDINEKPWRLTSLTVSYKVLVDALSFSYIDQAGKKKNAGPWGEGNHWDTTKTIRFGPSEFVKEVSGAYGGHNTCHCIVKFLTFVTNVGTYGPYGTLHRPGLGVPATHFRFVAEEGSSIVGFYGRSGRYIDAIGVYTVRVT